MNSAVEAAIIAGSVGVVTLVATLAAQYYGIKRTSRDTLNARFATAADKLGSEAAAVRLAGVYAMAGLADDWRESRQTCIDVLCGYLRMPYEPDPGEGAPAPEQLAFQANREIRHTVIRIITAHLRKSAPTSWRGLDFDFTGVVFDGGSFADAEFSGGTVDFSGAEFSGTVDFTDAKFSGGTVDFGSAKFPAGSTVNFLKAKFSGGIVFFTDAKFSGGTVDFHSAEFSDGEVSFLEAKFRGGNVSFFDAKFRGSSVSFWSARFSGATVSFIIAKFSGGKVDFDLATFSDDKVNFGSAEFSAGSTVDFLNANFSGATIGFLGAKFFGGIVDFSQVRDRSHPPLFDDWDDALPPGIRMPTDGWAVS